jgi:hypothetical protein
MGMRQECLVRDQEAGGFHRPAFRDLRTDPSFTFQPALRFVGGLLLHARQLGQRVEVGIAVAESE